MCPHRPALWISEERSASEGQSGGCAAIFLSFWPTITPFVEGALTLRIEPSGFAWTQVRSLGSGSTTMGFWTDQLLPVLSCTTKLSCARQPLSDLPSPKPNAVHAVADE